jgi:hypothetical protein
VSAETVISQLGLDIDGEAAGDQSGYSVALSSDGSRVAIGAPSNDGNGDNSGHVRIYDYDGSSWTQVGDIDGEAASDQSGSSVALSSDGSRVAIGAPENDGNGDNSGHVRIYDYDGSSWTQVGDIDGEAAFDQSGYSVALSSDGSRVAIGAPENNGNGGNSGHVRIYDYDGSSWTQVGSDIDGEAAGDQSGSSVALSSDGSRVAIGAPENDGNGGNSGHVRVFSAVELEAALTPTFATPTKTSDGFTVQVSNYDANYTWTASASAGSASISGTGLITVTGLSAGSSSTVTVGTTRTGYTAGSAAVSGAAIADSSSSESASGESSSKPYFGPISRPLMKTPANQGEESIILGFRMDTVESVHSGDHEFKIVSNSPSELVVLVPTGIHGLIDLTLAWENEGESGTYTIPQSLDIALEMEPDDIKAKSLKKLTTGSFKGFIAIYTKGYEGSKLSAKVAGKWLLVDSLDESWRGNDYSRTVRFTGAGYDIFVHLYIDGEYIRTDELTTK